MQPFEVWLSLGRNNSIHTMKNTNLFLLIAIVLSFTSCRKVLFDSGNLIVEERVISESYTGIVVEGSMDVYIVQDSTFDIQVEAGERKMPFIKTKVFSDDLIITEEDNHIINDKRTKVYVSASFLNRLEMSGSGNVYGTGIVGDYLNIDLQGSGDIQIDVEVEGYVDLDVRGSGDTKLTGTATSLSVNIEGSGDVDARYLPVDDCHVFIDGSGDVRVNVSSHLHIEINGSGDVYYWGDPESIDIDINGSGDVHHM